MNDSDESHSCHKKTKELIPIDAEDPEPKRFYQAAHPVNAHVSL